MGKLDDLELFQPKDRAAWRRWLTKNHDVKPGVWLVFVKSPAPNLDYEASVQEALCFGWIDSVVNTLDATRYKQVFTPRKPGSGWSATNKARVADLIASGRMQRAGQAAIDLAKANGMWSHYDTVEALEVPADLAKALRANRAAKKEFDAFPPGARKQILYWIHSAKRPETRARRIQQTVEAAAEGRRVNQPRD